ncbi:MAG TPA: hypothetical protein VMH50_13495 [Thermoleophilia bacterium]|nr:hypothetical protein [Thermoleophilia bacterium]
MAKAEIESGICGFCTTVTTTNEGRRVRVEFETSCGYVERLAEALTEVDPYKEISYRGEGPVTLKLAAEHLVHPACPVPSGIIKAIEVEAGLALPKDASIKPSRD